MRNIADVLDRCLAEIPIDFCNREIIESTFKSIKSSARYAAPELQPLHWTRAAEILASVLGTPTSDFRTKVADIFSGKS